MKEIAGFKENLPPTFIKNIMKNTLHKEKCFYLHIRVHLLRNILRLPKKSIRFSRLVSSMTTKRQILKLIILNKYTRRNQQVFFSL